MYFFFVCVSDVPHLLQVGREPTTRIYVYSYLLLIMIYYWYFLQRTRRLSRHTLKDSSSSYHSHNPSGISSHTSKNFEGPVPNSRWSTQQFNLVCIELNLSLMQFGTNCRVPRSNPGGTTITLRCGYETGDHEREFESIVVNVRHCRGLAFILTRVLVLHYKWIKRELCMKKTNIGLSVRKARVLDDSHDSVANVVCCNRLSYPL
jgi:hypothetical protein